MLATWMKQFNQWLLAGMLAFGLAWQATQAAEQVGAENTIEKIDFVTQSNGRVAVKIKTLKALQNIPPSFALNNPPRLAFDFLGVKNGLTGNTLNADQGVLKVVHLAEAKDRTRIVLNLTKSVGYTTSIAGNELTLLLQATYDTERRAIAQWWSDQLDLARDGATVLEFKQA